MFLKFDKKGHPYFSRKWAPSMKLLGESAENITLDDMVTMAQLQIEGNLLLFYSGCF